MQHLPDGGDEHLPGRAARAPARRAAARAVRRAAAAGAAVAVLLTLGRAAAQGGSAAASAHPPAVRLDPAASPGPGPLPVPLPVPAAFGQEGRPARVRAAPLAPDGAVVGCGGALCLRQGGWVYRVARPPAHRVPGEGAADARAAALLRAMVAAGAPRPPALLLPAAREPGVHVVIHKGMNRLYLLRGREVIAAFSVGTGRSTALTPEGRFRVAAKGVQPAWRSPDGTIVPGGTPQNPLGARWIGFTVTPGDGGLKYGIHGTNDPASIGGYVSSGCVRMHNADVIWLFARVPLGAWVYIER